MCTALVLELNVRNRHSHTRDGFIQLALLRLLTVTATNEVTKAVAWNGFGKAAATLSLASSSFMPFPCVVADFIFIDVNVIVVRVGRAVDW
jgi:hypothetical protein